MITRVQSVFEKGSKGVSEDALLINDGAKIFGVFDGATSLRGYVDPQGKTGGLIAAEIAKEAFNEAGSIVGAARDASDRIRDAMIRAGIDVHEGANRWATTAAVVRITPHSFEWLVVGDSVILMVMDNGSFKEVTPFHDHDTTVLIKWKKLAEERVNDIRERINEDLVQLRNESNLSFGVINGDDAVVNFLHSGMDSLGHVNHILLFTDGLLLPSEDPAQPKDFQKMVDLYLSGGLEEMKSVVRSQESSDPNCWRYPRFKPHDDIAAIAITF